MGVDVCLEWSLELIVSGFDSVTECSSPLRCEEGCLKMARLASG